MKRIEKKMKEETIHIVTHSCACILNVVIAKIYGSWMFNTSYELRTMIIDRKVSTDIILILIVTFD